MLAPSISKEASIQREAQLLASDLKELPLSRCQADLTSSKEVALVSLQILAAQTLSITKIQVAQSDQEDQQSKTINASSIHLV